MKFESVFLLYENRLSIELFVFVNTSRSNPLFLRRNLPYEKEQYFFAM